MRLEERVLWWLVLLAVCTVPANCQFVSITPNRASFPVAEVLTLECNTVLNASSYEWISDCISNECFPLYEEETQNVSTLNRPIVKALTSIDVGNYTCNVTLANGSILYASIYVNVSGAGVFEQVNLKSVANGSYFIADYDDYLNIELHCIGAMGEGMWINPYGSLLTTSDASGSASASGQEIGDIFEIVSYQGLGTSVLAHKPVLGSGLNSITNAFINPADEGYYTCVADDEHGIERIISVGLFLQGRAKTTFITSLSNITVTSPQNFTLNCTVTGFPLPSITWIKKYLRDNKSINIFSKEETSGNTVYSIVSITNSQANDSGVYVCSAENIVNSAYDYSIVYVSVKPSVSTDQDTYVTTLYTSVTGLCIATGVPAPYIILYELFDNGTRIPLLSYNESIVTLLDSGLYEVTQNITANSPTADLSGNYSCGAHNSVGVSYADFQLFVEFPPILANGASNVTITDTSSIDNSSFLCSGYGWPLPIIHWYLVSNTGSILLTNSDKYSINTMTNVTNNTYISSQLSITDITVTDGGIYTCNISNTRGYITALARLTVYVLPDAVSLAHIYTVNENSLVSFQCSATGVPAPSITWYRNGAMLSNETDTRILILSTSGQLSSDIYKVTVNLTLSNVKRNDSDYYSCTATNVVGNDTDKFKLTVNFVPDITKDPVDITVIQPANAIFTCSANGLPQPDITWTRTFNNETKQLLPSSKDYNITTTNTSATGVTSTLVILTSTPLDTGLYDCVISNSVNNVSTSAYLIVNVTPNITVNQSVYNVNENSSVSFQCIARGVPKPSITWYRNGTMIFNNTRFTLTSTSIQLSSLIYKVVGTLTLTNAYDTDTSTGYSCDATNIAGNDTDKFGLTVYFGTRLIQDPQSQTITEFNDVTFTCVVSGLQRPTLSWYTSAGVYRRLTNDSNVLIIETTEGTTKLTSILKLQNVSRTFDGEYQCIGNNSLANVTGTASLTVNFVPDITKDPVNITVIQPANAIFNCSANGLPQPDITWTRTFNNGTKQLLKSSDDYTITTTNTSATGVTSTLLIMTSTPLDTGLYDCVISNSVNNVSTSAYLIVNVTPNITVNQSVYTVNENSSITFKCIARGVPKPNITWYRNGTMIFNNTRFTLTSTSIQLSSLIYKVVGTLTLTNAYDTDTSTGYSCDATNIAGNDTDKFGLTVYFGTRLIQDPQSQTITEFNDVTFTCVVSGLQRPTLSWYTSAGEYRLLTNDSNVLITETTEGTTKLTSILKLQNVSRTFDGKYQCIGKNPLANINGTATLTINFVPDITEDPINITVIQPANAIFNCSANGLPQPGITWTRTFNNGTKQLLQSSKDYNITTTNTSATGVTSTLVIMTSTPLDTGLYDCVISNSVNNVSTSAYLIVNVTPNITVNQSVYTVNENSSITFKCIAGGVPKPSITWYRNGAMLSNETDIRISTSSISKLLLSSLIYRITEVLTLTDAQDNDSNTNYYCTATNIAGNNTDQFSLDVLVAPVITGPPMNYTIIQPHSVSFTCTVSGHPRPTIKWYRQTEVRVATELVTNTSDSLIHETLSGDRIITSIFTIPTSIPSDVGSYVCSAENSVIEHNSTAYLTVHVTPFIHYPISNWTFIVNESSSIVLTCNATGIPPPSLNWYRNSLLLDGSGNGINSRIKLSEQDIQNFTTSDGLIYITTQTLTLDSNGTDTGLFSCNASNVVTEVTVNFTVFVQVLPVVVPLDGDRHIIGIEDNFTTLTFRIDNAAPQVTSDNIRWIFSGDFSTFPNDTKNLEITDLSTRIGNSMYTFTPDKLSLNISNINQTDEGRYFLLVTNPAGKDYNHIDIIVHGPPYFIKRPSDETAVDGQNVTFDCEAVADPPHQVYWIFNNSKNLLNTAQPMASNKYSIVRDNTGIIFGRLTVHNLQYEDRGIYQCIITNYVGNKSSSALLTVLVSPVIHIQSNSTSLLISQPLTLFCIVTGYPLMNISWNNNSDPIQSNPNVAMETVRVTEEMSGSHVPQELNTSISNIPNIMDIGFVGLLKFKSVTRADTANYSCEATNMLQDTLTAESGPISLTVLEHPDPPINVKVDSYTARTIFVTWSPDFNGNSPIKGFNIYHKDLDRRDQSYVFVNPSNSENTTTNVTSYNITSGIIPYTKYQLTVVACNNIGCSDFDKGVPSIPIRTETDAPDSPPYDCQATANSSTAINLFWRTPMQANGLIQHYSITYKPLVSISGLNYTTNNDSSTMTTPTNSTKLLIPQLWKATSYSFSIIAYTIIGGSPVSTDHCTIFTLEDEPDQTPQHLLAYSHTSRSVTLSWSLPDLFYQNGNITRHRITTTTNQNQPISVRETTYIGRETTVQINELNIYTLYTFTVSGGTAVGFGPDASVIRRTLNDTSSAPGTPSKISSGGRNISITWQTPIHSNGEISTFKIYYQPSKRYTVDDPSYNSSERVTTVSSDVTTATLLDLYPRSTYIIAVTAINGAGESARSNSISVDTLVEPPPPVAKPVLPADAVDGRKVTIQITEPSNINGPISHYQVIAVLISGSSLPSDSPDKLFPSLNSFKSYDEISKTDSFNVAYIAAEFGSSLFPSSNLFVIGDPDNQPKDKSQYYNGPLRYGSSFTFFLRAYPISNNNSNGVTKQTSTRQYNLFTSSNYTLVITTVGDPRPAIAGSVVTVLLLIIIVIIVVIIIVVVVYKRRSGGFKIGLTFSKDRNEAFSMTSELSLPSIPNPAFLDIDGEPVGTGPIYEGHLPIAVGEFEKIVDRLHANDNYMFSQEYDEICRTSPQPSVDVCLNPMNKLRNRYANIQCYDHSRVKLIPVEDFPHDYINANFIKGYNREKEFIATQGPLPDTVGDFWRMVWDHNIPTVVMLTNLVEKMRVKCSQYWPDNVGSTEQFGNIAVTLIRSISHADYCIRVFEISAHDHKETREVKQFHYTSWPDFGVPRHPTPVLQFIRTLRRHHKYNDPRPIVIHCSAGVGRTGTLISIDVEMQRAEHEQEVNPYSFVRNMREDRNHMVQTETQYIFIHDALLEILATGWTDIAVEQLEDRMAELEEESEEGETGFSIEFANLQNDKNQFNDFSSARNDANKHKNRLLNVLPYDHNRVKLTKRPGEIGSDYINASFIDGYKEKNVFIATQGPLQNTVDDFWRMIWEQQVSTVVMLSKLEEKGQVMSVQYWPKTVGIEVNFGQISVLLESESTINDYIHRQMKITYTTRDFSDSRIVHQFNFTTWPKSGAPKNGEGMIDLIDQVMKRQQQTGNKPVVVHCSAGIGRTGAFCALSIAIERVKTEHLVNVFNIVKHLRTQRCNMVQTLEQYIFVYRALLEYVQSFSTYANFQSFI